MGGDEVMEDDRIITKITVNEYYKLSKEYRREWLIKLIRDVSEWNDRILKRIASKNRGTK
jgi:hypothetical protein